LIYQSSERRGFGDLRGRGALAAPDQRQGWPSGRLFALQLGFDVNWSGVVLQNGQKTWSAPSATSPKEYHCEEQNCVGKKPNKT
jgi:hypothetical protein